MTTSLESNLCNANLYFYIVKEKTYTSKQKKVYYYQLIHIQ